MGLTPGKIVVPLDGGYSLAVDGDPKGEVCFFLQNGGAPKPLAPKLKVKDLVMLAVTVLQHEWAVDVAPHQAVPFQKIGDTRRAAAVREVLEREQPIGRWGPAAPAHERRLFKEHKVVVRGEVQLRFEDHQWCFSHDRMSFVLLVDLLATVLRDEFLVEHTDLWCYHVPWLWVRPQGHWSGIGLSPQAPRKISRQDLVGTIHLNGSAPALRAQSEGGVATAPVRLTSSVTMGSPGTLLFLLQGLVDDPAQLQLGDDQIPSYTSLVGVAAVVVDELRGAGIEAEPLVVQPPTLSEPERALLEESARAEFLAPREKALSEREQQLAARERELANKIEQFETERDAALQEISDFEEILKDQTEALQEEQLEAEAAFTELGKALVDARGRGVKVDAPAQPVEETEELRVKRLRRKHSKDLMRLTSIAERVHRVQSGSKRKDLSDDDVEWAKGKVAEFLKLTLFTERELRMLTTKGFISSS